MSRMTKSSDLDMEANSSSDSNTNTTISTSKSGDEEEEEESDLDLEKLSGDPGMLSIVNSGAGTDPGSGAFVIPESGIREG